MKTKKQVKQTRQAKKNSQEASEKPRGGGRLDGREAKSKRNMKGKSTENVRTPN